MNGIISETYQEHGNLAYFQMLFFFTKSTELFLRLIRNYRTIAGANRTVDKISDF